MDIVTDTKHISGYSYFEVKVGKTKCILTLTPLLHQCFIVIRIRVF